MIQIKTIISLVCDVD